MMSWISLDGSLVLKVLLETLVVLAKRFQNPFIRHHKIHSIIVPWSAKFLFSSSSSSFLFLSPLLMGLWDSLLNWLRSLFFKQEMELSLVGLQNAGKTSLVNSIATGGYSEDMIPTVGFNMRKVTKGNVTIKLWDLGGQRRFRTMWERYCRGVSAIVYVVDAADRDSVPISRTELHELLTKPSLGGIPLLVLGNKIDKSEALSKQSLVDQLELESIKDREVCCYMISCKDSVNIDVVIDWLIKHSKTAK
ncbi:hypothetical protein RIF29_17366 [Crotalaria pallida]|uniref:Uncharacterized protein n=1 Tax=Crotalaria pallida TaxID=3830 RepID=A0AAN9FI96_CROPI